MGFRFRSIALPTIPSKVVNKTADLEKALSKIPEDCRFDVLERLAYWATKTVGNLRHERPLSASNAVKASMRRRPPGVDLLRLARI